MADKTTWKPILTARAAELAEEYGKQQIIIIACDRVDRRTDFTSWGTTAIDKEAARNLADLCMRAIGADQEKVDVVEDFHRDFRPAMLKEALDLLARVDKRSKLRPRVNRLLRLATVLGEGRESTK